MMLIVRNDPPAITRLFGTGLEEMDVFLTHVRRGTTYNIVCIALREDDQTPLMVYKDAETGNRWARPAEDFFATDDEGKPKWRWNKKADQIMGMIRSALKGYKLGRSEQSSR